MAGSRLVLNKGIIIVTNDPLAESGISGENQDINISVPPATPVQYDATHAGRKHLHIDANNAVTQPVQNNNTTKGSSG